MPDCCSVESLCNKHLKKACPKIKNIDDVTVDNSNYPSWVTNNLIFWKDGRIGEDNLLQTIMFLRKNGLIRENGKPIKD